MNVLKESFRKVWPIGKWVMMTFMVGFVLFRANQYFESVGSLNGNDRQIQKAQTFLDEMATVELERGWTVALTNNNPVFDFSRLESLGLDMKFEKRSLNKIKKSYQIFDPNKNDLQVKNALRSIQGDLLDVAELIKEDNTSLSLDAEAMAFRLKDRIRSGEYSFQMRSLLSDDLERMKGRISKSVKTPKYRDVAVQKMTRMQNRLGQVRGSVTTSEDVFWSQNQALNNLMINVESRLLEHHKFLTNALIEENGTFNRMVVRDVIQLFVLAMFVGGFLFFRERKGLKDTMEQRNFVAERELKDAQNEREILAVLQERESIPTVVTDAAGKVAWANYSFYRTLGIKTQIEGESWKNFSVRHIFNTEETTGIRGSVKLKSCPSRDFAVKTSASNGAFNKVIHFIPMEDYLIQLAKGNPELRIPQVVKDKRYSDMHDLLVDVSTNLSGIFRSLDLNCEFKQKIPLLTSIDAANLKTGVSQLVRGLLYFMKHSQQGSGITVDYAKWKNDVKISFTIDDAYLGEDYIERELRFKNKSYNSLAHYFAETERVLAAYGANINVRNLFDASRTRVQVEISMVEQKIKTKKSIQYKNLRPDGRKASIV